MEEERKYKIMGGYHNGRIWEGEAHDIICLYEDPEVGRLYGDKSCDLVINTHEYRMQRLVVGSYTQLVYVPLCQTLDETMKLLGFDKKS